MPETLGYIESLQESLRKAHGCESKHAASVPVEEVFQGKTIWKGTVEVFDSIGHPKAKTAYAWGHAAKDTGNEVRFVTVLGLPPVDSPRKAVQAVILSEIKQQKK
jgi:hypothetical protein